MDETAVHEWVAKNINKEGASVVVSILRDMGAWNETDEAEVASRVWRYDNDDKRRDGK